MRLHLGLVVALAAGLPGRARADEGLAEVAARMLASRPADRDAMAVYDRLAARIGPPAIESARQKAALLLEGGRRGRLDFGDGSYAIDASYGDTRRIDVHVGDHPASVLHVFHATGAGLDRVESFVETPEGGLVWKPGRVRFSFFGARDDRGYTPRFFYQLRGSSPRLLAIKTALWDRNMMLSTTRRGSLAAPLAGPPGRGTPIPGLRIGR